MPGHERADGGLQRGDGAGPDRVRGDAVDDDVDGDVAPVFLPPARQEGEPVDADDVPARHDDEAVSPCEDAEGDVVPIRAA